MSSRTPVNGVGYDQSLLADAPQVTKADKQEGYNPDLLESQPNPRTTPIPRAGASTPSKPKYAGASEDGHPIRSAAISQPPSKKGLSRKVIFIIVGIVFIVIVAVGVGVGVGVSKSHSSTAGGGVTGGPSVNSTAGTESTSKPDGTSSSSSTSKDGLPVASDNPGGQVATTTNPLGVVPPGAASTR